MKHPTSGDHPGLPPLDRRTLEKRLHDYVSEPLDGNALDRLLVHYGELARWAGRINLIGPGTVEVAAERHFGESVAALPLLAGRRRAVDIGSGAGFPGLVLAAARPDLEVILVEARQRKWAFLEAVARKASLSCRVLNATVVAPLPADFPDETDVITLRALRLQGRVLGALAERVRPGGAFLLWTGEAGPAAPDGWVAARAVALPGPPGRRIQEYVR